MRTVRTWLRTLLSAALFAAWFPIAAAAQQGIAAPPAGTPLITHIEMDNTAINNGTTLGIYGGLGLGVAYNPSNGDIYFAQNYVGGTQAQIGIIHANGTTGTLPPPPAGPFTNDTTGGFGDLTALTFYNGKLYAADGTGFLSPGPTALNLVWQYDPNNTGTNGGWSQTVPSVNNPTGLAFDPLGNLYVSSWGATGAYTVNKYQLDTANGLFDLPPTTLWTTTDSSEAPYGLAFDQLGNLCIAGFGVTANGTKVFRVSPNGTISVYFDAAAADPSGTFFNDTTNGASGQQYQAPSAIAFDANDYMYVGYYNAEKIVRIAPNGTSIAVFPGGGSGDDAPNGLAVTPQGDVITILNGGGVTSTPAVIRIHGMGPSINAAADFSPTANGGPWGYGYMSGLPSGIPFTALSSSPNVAATDFIAGSASPYGLDFWVTNPLFDPPRLDPDVVHNSGASTLTPFCCAVILPNGLGLQGPPATGFGADVRWTALFSGQYSVFGIWSGLDFSGPTNTTGLTIINSSVVSSPGYSINSFGPLSSNPITAYTTLSANGTIDFNVAPNTNNGMTGLDAVVVQAGDTAPLSINGNAIWLRTQPVGTSANSAILTTFTNNSADAQTISQIQLVGANASDFQISGDGCSNNTISVGGTCSFVTSLLPSALGARTAFILAKATDNTTSVVVSEQFPAVGIGVANTTVSLISSANPISWSGFNTVTYTATVASALAASPVGSAQFYDGQTPLGTPVPVNLSSGTATYTQTNPGPGNHAIAAVFIPGSSTFVGISSASMQEVLATPVSIYSASAATFYVGQAGSFQVSASGIPAPSISITSGTLPAGLTFTDSGAGYATISGTPASGTSATYNLTITAANLLNSTTQSFTLTVTGFQNIAFPPIPNHFTTDAPFTVAATASSGLTVTLTPSGSCTITGFTVTITAAGMCAITATQPGDSTYGAATPVIQAFNITNPPLPCPPSFSSTVFASSSYSNAGGAFPFFGGEAAGVATDPAGNVYAALNPFPFQTAPGGTFPGATPAILMVSPVGAQTLLAPPGGFGEVTGVAFYDGSLYVGDGIGYTPNATYPQATPGNAIWKYTPGGGWSQIIFVNNPTGIAFFGGNIYVSSWQDQNVYAFSPAGTTLGTVWHAPDATAAPYGLAFDAKGDLFIAGFGGGSSSTGTKIFEVLAADVAGYTQNYSVFFDPGVKEPASLTFDAFGNLFAAYYDSGDIIKITPTGSSTRLSVSLTGAPNGLAFDVNNNLYTMLNNTTLGGQLVIIQGTICSPITPTISWPTPAPILSGTALSATQLDATAVDASNNPIAGTLTYTPPAGTLLNPGIQTLSVAFAPTDTTDYLSAAGSAQLTVNQAPAFTSAASTTFSVGTAGSFTATASGYPVPSFTESGPLPNGVTLSSAGLLTGTPATGSGGVYNITITATNGISPNATQAFTLTVTDTPTGTSISATPVDTTTKTSPVTLIFASVTQAGYTTLTTSGTGPAVPSGFSLGSPAIYYNLSTTAVYSGPITISINFAGTTFTTTPHLLHYDTTTGTWTDITTQTIGTVIHGTVSSLSPFLVAEETPTAPAVTTNPASQTVTAGASVTFTAAASGKPAPTVQWQASTDGGATFTNISGATSATLTLTAVTASQNGNMYRAVFTNSVGSATTSAATLTVNSVPSVTTNPLSQMVTVGSNVTFTAAATGNPTPTAQWQVSANGGASYANIVGATSTTLTLTGVTASQNNYQYQAVFTNLVGSATTSGATLTVNSAPTVTTNPVSQTVTAGSNVTFTAAATGNPLPAVQWQVSTNGGASYANITGATSTTLTLAGVTSSQNGYVYEALFTNSVGSATSGAAILTVTSTSVATSTVVTASPNPVIATQSVTFTATVTSASGTPTGSVTFTYQPAISGGTSGSLGSVPLVSGTASITVLGSALPLGSDIITATYTGSASFNASTGKVGEQVLATYPTTTTITSSANPALSAQTIVFTASVSSASGTPTGNVTFIYKSTLAGSATHTIGTVALSSGVASVSVLGSSLPRSATITATYGGSAAYTASSASLTQQVLTTYPTSTAVTAKPSPVLTSESVMFTATVSSADGTPTGNVTFSYVVPGSGSLPTTLGTELLSSGTASLTVAASSLPTGTIKITAAYGGLANSYGASSGSVNEQVFAAFPTKTVVSATPSPVLTSESVTLTATVSSAYGTPTGNVTFSYINPSAGTSAITLGTATLSSGIASLTTAASALPVGKIKITAAYGGLVNTFSGSSGSVSEQVFVTFPTKTTVTVTPNPASATQNITLTATVTSSDGAPTGSVTFTCRSNSGGKTVTIGGPATISSGTASLTVPASSLPVGTDTITAKYGGSTSFSASSGSTPETVN